MAEENIYQSDRTGANIDELLDWADTHRNTPHVTQEDFDEVADIVLGGDVVVTETIDIDGQIVEPTGWTSAFWMADTTLDYRAGDKLLGAYILTSGTAGSASQMAIINNGTFRVAAIQLGTSDTEDVYVDLTERNIIIQSGDVIVFKGTPYKPAQSGNRFARYGNDAAFVSYMSSYQYAHKIRVQRTTAERTGNILDRLVADEKDIESAADLAQEAYDLASQGGGGGGGIVVDKGLSNDSKNPVQNKVITAAIAEVDGRVSEIEGSIRKQVLLFGGFISSVITVTPMSYGGEVNTDNIKFYESENTFVYKSGSTYYAGFDGSNAYKPQGIAPAFDALYIYNGTLYRWYGNSLSPYSGGGGGGAADVDGITITTKTIDGVQKIAMADNAKTSSNTVGTALLTNGVMPTSAGSTRYVLYKDVNYGNATSSKSISLSPGSKLVPNGGLPKVVDEQDNYLSPMPVEGGELSWVHSSDIGMIQDGQLPTGKTREDVGKHNADVLRMVAASRWNLILDGTYYVNVGIKPGDGTRELVVEKAVTLRRPLRIKGGGLIAECNLFCVEAGGGLVLEDVTLDNLNSYGMIYLDPWGGLIESVELYRCKLKTSTSKSIGKFITASSKNVGPTDTVNDYTPDGISRTFNETSGVKFLGLPSVYIDSAGKSHSTWGLKSATTKVPTQNYCYYEGYKPEHPYFPGGKDAAWADAWCCYDQGAQLYVPYDNGENDRGAYVFRERRGTPGDGGSTIKHKGMQGDFVLKTTTRNTDVLYEENGEVVHFRPLYLHDELVDGELVFKTGNPEVDHNGMRKFIVDGCSIMTRSTVFLIGGLAVEEEFRVSNNLFYDIGYLTMNFGTDNNSEASDEWNYRSCPFEVYGNIFRGVGYVVESGQPYAGVMLYEGNTILFHDNLVENIITTTNTYDSYLSCAKVELRNNVIRNVLKWKNEDHSLYGYFKAKGARVGFNYDAKYGGDRMNHPRKLSRLYEGNLYEENMKDIRQMCDSYMQKYRSIYFPTYADTAWEDIPQEAKDDVLKENVLRTMFDNVVSPWSFDTFTIRNNIFDMPDCALNGSASSGGSAKLRRFILNGNVFKFREFCSSPSNGYNHYLFVIDPTSEGAEAEIIGNTFESKGNEIINVLDILGTGGSETFKSFRVEDNKFVNCGYRISQGPNFNGLINAESIRILGNKESAGLDDGYEIYACKLDDYERNIYGYTYLQYHSGYNVLGKDNSNYKLQGVPIRYNGPGTFEFWDSQKNGVPANAGKFFRLPVDKSRVVVKSTHMCRPAPFFVDAEADKNPSARYSTHIRTVANTETFTITDIEDCPVGVEVTIECGSVSSGVKIEQSGYFANIDGDWIPAVGDRIVLIKTMTWSWKVVNKERKYSWSFSEVSRSTAAQHANVIDLPDYFAERSIAFAYDMKDVKGYCVTVRYRLNGMWKEKKVEFRCIAYTSSARGVSARGADGRRFANYQIKATVKYFELGGIEELGMHFALRHCNLGDATTTNPSWISLNIFTDEGGTKNDPDSEMTIEICDTTGNADVGRTIFTYGDTSPFETFLPKGSTLSADERTALLTGDVSAYNMSPQSDTAARKCTLIAADTGWWCKDSQSGETVVWLGSKWSDDSATIRESQLWSGTQTQYDALTAEQKASIIAFIEES